MKTKVTYIGHSGFLVETESSYLLFDYWKGSLPEFDKEKTLYIFSSHVHHDHFTKNIFLLQKETNKVNYILSADIKTQNKDWKNVSNLLFVKEYENVFVDECQISTLKSTDEGVAFVVDIDGVHLYHAGDLHDWYWPGEPEDENILSGENYHKEIERIKQISFDVSFIVLDPRQEYAGGRGMDYFLENVHSNYVFPMHWWNDGDYVSDYVEKNQKKYPTTKIVKIDRCNQIFEIH